MSFFYFFDVACENADIIISFNWITDKSGAELSSMLSHTKEFYNTNTLWGLLYGGFLLIIYCYLAEIYSVFLFYVEIYSGQNLATITNP